MVSLATSRCGGQFGVFLENEVEEVVIGLEDAEIGDHLVEHILSTKVAVGLRAKHGVLAWLDVVDIRPLLRKILGGGFEGIVTRKSVKCFELRIIDYLKVFIYIVVD